MRRLLLSISALLLGIVAARAAIDSTELDHQASEYVTQTVAAAKSDDRTAIVLFREIRDAMADKRYAVAVHDLMVLAGRHGSEGEGGFETWYRLGLALQLVGGGPRDLPAGEASAAAYRAYQLANTSDEQLKALLLLGSLLAQASTKENGRTVYSVDDSSAYQVFAEIGRLAGNNPFEDRRKEIAPRPFRLDRITYPLPPGKNQSEGQICEGDYGDTSARDEFAGEESALQNAGDSGARIQPTGGDSSGSEPTYPKYQLRCSTSDRRNTCLTFSNSVPQDPSAIARAIVVRRTDPEPGLMSFSDTSVAVPASDLAIDVRERSICFSDLQFGSRYQFQFLDDFRSAGGAKLLGANVAEVDLPNRPRSLGFRRGAYVLPSTGEKNVVIRAVNTPQAGIMIRRLGDLQLMRELVRDDIVGKFDQADACFILGSLGEQIANGWVRFGKETNQEVEFSLPFGHLIEARRAWLEGNSSSQALRPEFRPRSDLSFTFSGDPASAAMNPRNAGVYVVFGDIATDYGPAKATAPFDPNNPDQCREGSAAQWLVVTNIGLTVQRSASHIYAIARALDTGAALNGVRIEFVARSGQVLAEGKTDANGMVDIPARLGRGEGGNELIAVLGYADGDFTFLDMKSDSISIADRGFDGSPQQKIADAFIAPSRGIFRPGETVQALVLVRTPLGQAAPQPLPVDVSLRDARGALIGSVHRVSADELAATAGGYFFEEPLPADTLPEGELTLEARIGKELIGSASIEVRFYEPDTIGLKFNEPSWSATLSPAGELNLSGTADASYLYALTNAIGDTPDAPAAHVQSQLDVRLEPAPTPDDACFRDFTFGRNADRFVPKLFRGGLMESDDKGHIEVNLQRDGVPPTEVPAAGCPVPFGG